MKGDYLARRPTDRTAQPHPDGLGSPVNQAPHDSRADLDPDSPAAGGAVVETGWSSRRNRSHRLPFGAPCSGPVGHDTRGAVARAWWRCCQPLLLAGHRRPAIGPRRLFRCKGRGPQLATVRGDRASCRDRVHSPSRDGCAGAEDRIHEPDQIRSTTAVLSRRNKHGLPEGPAVSSDAVRGVLRARIQGHHGDSTGQPRLHRTARSPTRPFMAGGAMRISCGMLP